MGHELGHEVVALAYVNQRKFVYDQWLVKCGQNPHALGTPAADDYFIQILGERDAAWIAMDEDGDGIPDDIDPDGIGDDHEQLAEGYAFARQYDVSENDEWSEGGKNDV